MATKNRTALVYDERMVEHECIWDPEYPEKPERFSASLQKCRDYGLVDRCHQIPSRAITEPEILKLHDQSYLDLFKTTDKNQDAEALEKLSSEYDSVYFHPKTYELALLAAGSTIDLVLSVISGETQNGMAIVRPPGHHAMTAEFCGYCFFNNIALAAQTALDNQTAKRILIVDWDVHHGQATQRMFYDDPRVLYFSIHRYEHGEFWPELRESNFDHVGQGKGLGYNVNVPLNQTGMGDADYMAIFNNILLPIAYEYNPDLVLVSAGFDAAFGCPEGEMKVTPACYAHLTHSLMGLAQGKVCVVLEGGYFIKSLAEGVAFTLRALLGDPCPNLGPLPAPCESVIDTILNVISAQRKYWRSLAFQGSYKQRGSIANERKKHVPVIEYRGTLGVKRPEVFPTREYYLKHSEERMLELTDLFEDWLSNVDLTTPTHRVALAFDPSMAMHQSILEKVHPEKPERILKIFEKLKDRKLVQRCHKLQSRHATEEELKLAHTPEYVALMKHSQSESSAELITLQETFKSIYLCSASYDCATLAVGCLLQVVDSVLTKTSRSGVAIIRPPGHHAESDEACGFCIFNNVALAARYALAKHSLKRVLIVDWDVHHGNGIQHQFDDEPRVFYISLHRYDNSLFFPFSYDADYTSVGKGSGTGFNMNIPWSKGRMSDGDYLAAFFQLVLPVAQQFDPELVLVSAGFDAARGDPLGGCAISPDAYGHMTHMLSSLANGRVVLALEGGYNVPIISSCMSQCVGALLGDPLPPLVDSLKPCQSAVQTIINTMQTHSKYWNCFKFDADLPNFAFAKIESEASPDAFEVHSFKGQSHSQKDDDKVEASGGAVDNSIALELEIGFDEATPQFFAVQPLPWCPHLKDLGELPGVGLDNKSPCDECYDVSENWVCLVCFQVYCGRYVKQHMMGHYESEKHPLALSFSDLSVWCYECDSYVDNQALDYAKDEAYLKKFGLSRLSIE